MPNFSLTAEPLGVRVMDVKVRTENILYSHFLLQGEAVILTCQEDKQTSVKRMLCDVQQAVEILEARLPSRPCEIY